MKLQTDKILHFLAGLSITAIVTLYAPLWAAILSCLIVGIGKEVYDLKIKHTKFDSMDLFVTVLGAVAFSLFYAVAN